MPANFARKAAFFQSLETQNRSSIPRNRAELRTFSGVVITLKIKGKLRGWLAATAVEHHTGVKVRARQSSMEGRDPRLEGTEGKVLLSYLQLASPNLSEWPILRIITKRRRARKGKPVP